MNGWGILRTQYSGVQNPPGTLKGPSEAIGPRYAVSTPRPRDAQGSVKVLLFCSGTVWTPTRGLWTLECCPRCSQGRSP